MEKILLLKELEYDAYTGRAKLHDGKTYQIKSVRSNDSEEEEYILENVETGEVYPIITVYCTEEYVCIYEIDISHEFKNR